MNLYALERLVARAFGRTLEEARTSRDITRAVLANRSGVPHGLLRRLERGVRNPSLAVVIALARGLEISPEALVSATIGRLEDDPLWLDPIPSLCTFGMKRLYRLASRQENGLLSEDWTAYGRWQVAVEMAHRRSTELVDRKQAPLTELVVYVQASVVTLDFAKDVLGGSGR